MNTAQSSLTPARESKHAAVADELRRQILAGELKPGDRLPSYQESRVLFGVHTVTLEKAHAQLEREGIIVRIRGRGTFVAPRTPVRSRAHSPKSTGIIGLAGDGFGYAAHSSYWSLLLNGMNQVASEAGMRVLLLDTNSPSGWEKADGVILCDWSRELSQKIVPPSLPCVSLLVPVPGMTSVVADDYNGSRLATDHLLALGHRKIAFMSSHDVSVSPRRRAGWADALQANGITMDPRWGRHIGGFYDYGFSFAEEGRRSMTQWLDSNWQELGCTAILAHNDYTALGIVDALRQRGLQVPSDVSVIGFDGGEICDYCHPRLTTIEIPLAQIGCAAMRQLLDRLESDLATQHQTFSVVLRERDSTATCQAATALGDTSIFKDFTTP